MIPVEPKGPLLAISCGMGRTGTLSLKFALEKLMGRPCYHMYELVYTHPEHINIWSRILENIEKNPNSQESDDDIRLIFDDYRASTDHPGSTIYKQLMRIYPESKFVLTVRDSQVWLDSMRASIRPKQRRVSKDFIDQMIEYFTFGPNFFGMGEVALQLALGVDVDMNDDAQMIAAFENRIETIKRTVPADRLLVFRAKDGWEPLCKFLNFPIPEEPFPHVNDRATLSHALSRKEFISSTVRWTFDMVVGTVCAGGFYLALKHFRP